VSQVQIIFYPPDAQEMVMLRHKYQQIAADMTTDCIDIQLHHLVNFVANCDIDQLNSQDCPRTLCVFMDLHSFVSFIDVHFHQG